MVAYKTGSFQRILKSLEPECRAALVYGPDAGLVAERQVLRRGLKAGEQVVVRGSEGLYAGARVSDAFFWRSCSDCSL